LNRRAAVVVEAQGDERVVRHGCNCGGGGSSATFPPIIPGSSGTINADISNLLYITSNEAGASIFINGENTYKVTPQKITNFLSDTILQQNGAKRITLQKEGFESNEEYVINVINNNCLKESKLKLIRFLSQSVFLQL
jgi:hypothetical protein